MASINIKQQDLSDCGAACLSAISSHYNLHIPIAKIRQYASTNKKGTNVLGMVEAAQKLGFEAKGVKGTLDSLTKIPLPAIAHVIIKDLHHFVVIIEIRKNTIIIMDPADGKTHKKTLNEFKEIWKGVLILLIPNENFKEKNEKVSTYKRFWFLLKPHKLILIQSLFGGLIYTLLGFSTSIYIQKLTDFVLIDVNTNLLNLLSVIMLILLFLQLTIGAYKDVFLIKTGQLIDSRLILGYYKHLLKLPQQFFDTMRVGEIISRVNDAVKIRLFINTVSLNLMVNIMVIVFSFIIMFFYYWKLALIMFTIIPVYIVLYVIINKLNKNTERKIMENAAELESQLVESIKSMGTIKRFSTEEFVNIKTETRFLKLLRIGYKSALNSIFSQSSTTTLAQLFIIILLWTGSYFVIDNEITPGELLSFYAIIGYFVNPIASLINSNKEIQNALIASDRLFDIMDLELDNSESKIILKKEMLGDVKFKKVDFCYGSNADVFKDFSLNIPIGKITAIIGESGSGKSSLLSLLQNLYPIQSGKIFIGDIDITNIESHSLKELVAVVPQKIDLFSGTILDNIALGIYEPDIKKVLHVCSKVGLLEHIYSLPNGINTEIGEDGSMLSGGQRQKIAIARALYRDPEILILDEATSSLDSISESFVQDVIKDFRNANKTVILIAHRLSSVVNADIITVLEKGRVVEKGTHSQLYQFKNQYYNLWQQQLPFINKI